MNVPPAAWAGETIAHGVHLGRGRAALFITE